MLEIFFFWEAWPRQPPPGYAYDNTPSNVRQNGLPLRIFIRRPKLRLDLQFMREALEISLHSDRLRQGGTWDKARSQVLRFEGTKNISGCRGFYF